MANLVTIVKTFWHFVTEKLWHVRLDKVDKTQGFFIRQLRIFSLAIKGFNEDKCLTKATALTFYTIFSIVPVLALAFAISKGFGLEKNLQEMVSGNYPEYKNIIDEAFVSASKLLSTAKGGVIAGFGIVLLLWSVLKLLVSIEENFNEIWEIKKGRTWVRKFTDYLTVMLIGPVFLIVAGGLTVAIQTKVGNIHLLGFVSTILIKLLAYSLIVCVFMFLYLILPNTKVSFKSSLVAALIATVLFQILQWAYVKFQIGANHLNAIYGGFAALPLFLIWMQYSWYIVLFGAEIAFANQNIDHYELDNEIKKLSIRYKKVIALMIANIVGKQFYNDKEPLTSIQIAKKLDLPVRLARTIINEFVESGIFIEMRTDSEKEIVYQPGITESKFTVKNVLELMEKHGVNSLPINDTSELIVINKLMQDLDKTLDNELGNTFIKDIVK
ncbi:MAG: YihY/virulence factor BrkB family protein [Bacteroidota bacterium]|nr:YihY/virulence factor BrkB family protein [Bacteroidota bacterium]MDP3146195.1 YihY/virulence factor BrkB family protein [Bacteroidota bacterium]MDP3556652.1 YihY/virulence factor BrkB family protein [Bacteroidota bacterium]